MSTRVYIAFFIAIFLALSPIASKNIKFEGYKVRRLVIDAGHGGRDTGCNGRKSIEKEITLPLAFTVKKLIAEKYPDVEIMLSRTDDTFMRPGARADFANCQKADLLISIHCNSLPRYPDVHGTETYVMRHERNRLDVDVPDNNDMELHSSIATGNAADIVSSNSVIASLHKNPNLYQSVKVANFVEKRLTEFTPLESRGVRQENLSVLRDTYMPAILIEIGYLSNPEEENYIISPEGHANIAKSIASAFGDYKEGVENTKLFK